MGGAGQGGVSATRGRVEGEVAFHAHCGRALLFYARTYVSQGYFFTLSLSSVMPMDAMIVQANPARTNASTA